MTIFVLFIYVLIVKQPFSIETGTPEEPIRDGYKESVKLNLIV